MCGEFPAGNGSRCFLSFDLRAFSRIRLDQAFVSQPVLPLSACSLAASPLIRVP